MFLLATSISVRADYTATVNSGSVLVTNFQGWGTSLAWWANVIGSYPNRTNYVDLAFSQLKLNIVRYNIGGGQNPTITVPGQGDERERQCATELELWGIAECDECRRAIQ